MTVAKAFIMVQKFLPHGPNKSKMAYEIYRHKDSTEEAFKAISEPYARVMNEDKVLCMGQQSNLDRGVFTNGLLHPRWEKAPIFFQSAVREAVTEHYEMEKRAGREIWPARQKAKGAGADVSAKDEDSAGDSCVVGECLLLYGVWKSEYGVRMSLESST